MIQIYDDDTLEAARTAPLDTTTRDLVERIVSDALASDLWELTYIAVLESTDSAASIEQVLGFDPKLGPLGDVDGAHTPWWDWLEHRPGYFELLHTTGTDFAYFLLVPDLGPDPTGLARLCREAAGTLET